MHTTWFINLPPKGCSCGQTNTLAYSIQCSGRRGVCAIVHKGKLTCEDKFALDVQKKLIIFNTSHKIKLRIRFLLVEDTDQECTQYRLLVQE